MADLLERVVPWNWLQQHRLSERRLEQQRMKEYPNQHRHRERPRSECELASVERRARALTLPAKSVEFERIAR